VSELANELDRVYAALNAARGPSTALVVWKPSRR